MPGSLEEAEQLQPELFPPPDPAIWTAERSCASLEARQCLIDHLETEIRWRSTQYRNLKRTAKGRVLDCCDYFDGRKFSLQELKRRHTELRGVIGNQAAFEAALCKPTRREARRRKSAPLHLRLAAYLDPIARAGGGAWKPAPSYELLAEALGVCIESISQAFKKLEEDPQCPLAFSCAYSGPKRCRQKHIALKAWLKYDGLPLHFEKEGRHRKLRPTFRKGVERIEPHPIIVARYGRKNRITGQASRATSFPNNTTGNSRKCLSHSIRLSPAVLDNPWNVPAKTISRPPRPYPRRAAMSKSLERAAWRAAREAKKDGELFWDNAKPKIPLPVLKSLILEAFELGLEWKKHVRPALSHAIHEAHAAACLADPAIRNPGAFAATIYRERIASIRPDPNHLTKVIEARRSQVGSPQSYQPLLPPPPGSSDAEVLRYAQAEGRASLRLYEFMDQNPGAFAVHASLSIESFNDAILTKLREFTEEEYANKSAIP